MSRTTSFHDLREALAQPDCAVCRLKADATEHYLDSLLWESVNDPRTLWERLAGQLGERIRKSDYRFRDEPWGQEGDAWRRAIPALVGARRKG